MSAKAARRQRKKQRKERPVESRWGAYGPIESAPEWASLPREHLEHVCRTLDRIVGLRNLVIADLREHLTLEHRAILAWPVGQSPEARRALERHSSPG